jgi:hypothetical protein
VGAAADAIVTSGMSQLVQVLLLVFLVGPTRRLVAPLTRQQE